MSGTGYSARLVGQQALESLLAPPLQCVWHFYMGAENPDSGPHVCMVSTLETEALSTASGFLMMMAHKGSSKI